MTPEAPTYPSHLPQKPLVEAIFELRWALHTQGSSSSIDPGFRFLLGRYQERMTERYPVAIELPAAAVPEEMTAYVVRHQFQAASGGWPVTQLGPGILTVNDTDGYEWESFEARIVEAAASLFEAYPTGGSIPPLQPMGAVLRYQNAMPYDPEEVSPREFMKNNLHTSFEVDDDLYPNVAILSPSSGPGSSSDIST